MPENDLYARNEHQRSKAYHKAYQSSEVQDWVASLSPQERERAAALGLLSPLPAKPATSKSLETLLIKQEPHDELLEIESRLKEENDLPLPVLRRLGSVPLQETSDIPSSSFLSLLSSERKAMLEAFLQDGGNPRLRWACLRYLLGHGTCESHARTLGMSKQSFHYHVRKLEKQFGIQPQNCHHSENARNSYKKLNCRKQAPARDFDVQL